ncbi:hypothetical protein V8C86DRAFT_2889896 [Haematococcus lacustris]
MCIARASNQSAMCMFRTGFTLVFSNFEVVGGSLLLASLQRYKATACRCLPLSVALSAAYCFASSCCMVAVCPQADRASKDARLIVMDPTLLLQTDVEVAAPAVGEGVAAAATGEGWAVAIEGDAMPKKATAAACLSSLERGCQRKGWWV